MSLQFLAPSCLLRLTKQEEGLLTLSTKII
jgi:hypothetical protein